MTSGGRVSSISLGSLGELSAEGFESNDKYNMAKLRERAREGTIFDAVPRGSTQRYGVVVQHGTVTSQQCHAIWVRLDDQVAPRGKWRMVTLLRSERDRIKVVPGWV